MEGKDDILQLHETIKSLHNEVVDLNSRMASMERACRDAARDNETSRKELKTSIRELKDILTSYIPMGNGSSSPSHANSEVARKRNLAVSSVVNFPIKMIKRRKEFPSSDSSSSSSSTSAAATAINIMQRANDAIKIETEGYFLESLKGVLSADVFYDYEMRGLDHPVRGSGWALKAENSSVKTDSGILSSVRSTVAYFKTICTDEEKLFLNSPRPIQNTEMTENTENTGNGENTESFPGGENTENENDEKNENNAENSHEEYNLWCVMLRRVGDALALRAFQNLALLDPGKSGGHNMTISAMSRRITKFIKLAPHTLQKHENGHENGNGNNHESGIGNGNELLENGEEQNKEN